MAVSMEVQKSSLVDVRIDAGFTSQAALATSAGIAESTVWGAENGRRISYQSARRMVNAIKRAGYQIEVTDLDWNVESK